MLRSIEPWSRKTEPELIFDKQFQTRLTPLRKEKDERRANYEKRRDQRRRSVHSSDHEAKKEIPKLTSTPKKTKKPKARLQIIPQPTTHWRQKATTGVARESAALFKS